MTRLRSYQDIQMPDLMKANLEALAENEALITYTCEGSITEEKGHRTFFCGTCDWVENSAAAWYSWTKTCVK